MYLTEELALFFADLEWDAVPDAIRVEAKRMILDTLGCIAAAAESEVGPMVDEIAALFGASTTGRQTILGASYAYGKLANAMDFDETYPPGFHVAQAAVATALSIAHARQLSGTEFLLAAIAGYELGARIAQAMGSSIVLAHDGGAQYAEIWGTSPPVIFGAVGAAAKALGLDARVTAEAYANAAALTAIPATTMWAKMIDVSNFKYCESGWLSMAGAFAALSAERGLRAIPEILDGEHGYLRMLGISRYDRSLFNAELGRHWLLSNIAYKPWPVCWRMIHPLTALDRLIGQHQFDLDAIERVSVETTPLALTLNQFRNPQPRDFFSRQFSFPHGHAMLLLGVSPGLSWLSPDDALERRAAPLRDKIELKPHPGAMSHATDVARGEYRRVFSRVTVHIGNRAYQAEAEYACGDARQSDCAWGNADIANKFRTLMGSGDAEGVIDAILNAETLQDISVVTTFMEGRATRPVA